MKLQKLERAAFRALNGVVEPLLEKGVGSSGKLPVSLVLLETTGFKSGKRRRTPLWSVRLGDYRLVSTLRGGRSFWAKNLSEDARARVTIGGVTADTDAIVITPGYNNLDDWDLDKVMSGLAQGLVRVAQDGWAFAVLVPAEGNAS